MSTYPGGIATFTTKNTGDTIAASHVNTLQAEITAIETALINGFPQTFLPLTDATYNLGSGAKQWLNLYLSGALTAATVTTNGAITANGANVTGQTLVASSGGLTSALSPNTLSFDAATGLRAGTGSPEGVLTSPIGAEFQRTNGGLGTTFYKKLSGAGNTGWVVEGASTGRTFAAGNFTPASGTWTVGAGDVDNDSYRIVGDTLVYTARLKSTTTAGGPTSLAIALPGGYTAAEKALQPVMLSVDNGTTFTVGYSDISSGQTTVKIWTANSAAFANVTDLLWVCFSLIVKVS